MRILVTGASGFVGGHLARRLEHEGHDVLAMTRHPDRYAGAGRAVPGDITEPGSIRAALDGVDVAYYMVHSLDHTDFVARDAEGAATFADAARVGGVARIVYLGALGNDDGELSEHLASRRQVEDILRERASTVALRAGIVVGQGGISWEILCQLVERLPVMITPRWVQTRTQPVGLEDAVTFLAAAATLPADTERHFDIGAPAPSTYLAMMRTVADLMARRRVIVPVPVLTPRLSSGWLRLVTDVDFATAKALVDSMTTEVVVEDRDIETYTGHRAMTFEEAARRALAARASTVGAKVDEWTVNRSGVAVTAAEPDASRPAAVVGSARRARVTVGLTLVAGAACIAGTLLAPRDSAAFYVFGFGLIGVWLAGSLAAGPVRLVGEPGWQPARRVLLLGASAGVLAYGLFALAARLAPHLPVIGPWLDRAVADLLATADAGRLGLVLALALGNAVTEELFFRGALVDAIGSRRGPLVATLAYVAVTVAGGNVALVVAAAVMGTLFMLERLHTGGTLAPIVTHLTWSTLVVLALPR